MSTPPSPHVPPIPPIGSGQRVNKRFRSDERVEPAASVPPLPVRERPAPRYQVLDTLRGFAICGILLVNIGDITHLGMGLPFVPRSPSIAENTLYYLVSTRFVPIFAFMFGMSLRFVSDSALKRGQSPWKVVGRRMIALLAIGFLHSLVYSGEVLTEYAVIGLLMLPIVLKAPRLLVAILGVAGTVASFAWGGSGVINVPGLFLLGAAAVAYGLPAYLEHPDRRLVMTTAALALAAVPAVIAQTHETGDPRFEYVGGIAGGIAEMLGRKNFSKGVKVEVGEKEAAVDLYIIVKYGIRIPEVALATQENVKRAIETMTGLSVVEVNVHVQGVGFPEEEPKVEESRVH